MEIYFDFETKYWQWLIYPENKNEKYLLLCIYRCRLMCVEMQTPLLHTTDDVAAEMQTTLLHTADDVVALTNTPFYTGVESFL